MKNFMYKRVLLKKQWIWNYLLLFHLFPSLFPFLVFFVLYTCDKLYKFNYNIDVKRKNKASSTNDLNNRIKKHFLYFGKKANLNDKKTLHKWKCKYINRDDTGTQVWQPFLQLSILRRKFCTLLKKSSDAFEYVKRTHMHCVLIKLFSWKNNRWNGEKNMTLRHSSQIKLRMKYRRTFQFNAYE